MAVVYPEIEYELSDMVEVKPTPRLNLPGIHEEQCLKPKDDADYWVFLCTPSESNRNEPCPVCGSVAPRRSMGYLPKRRLVHDVSVGNIKIDLLLSVPRYKCQDCDSTIVHEYEAVEGSRQMTKRLCNYIKRESFNTTFRDLSIKYGYAEPTIAAIFDDYARELETNREAVIAPRVLGIDEKFIVNQGRGVFVDIESGRLIEMTENNKKSTVISTIESMVDYGKNIEIVTMDMSQGYRSIIQEILPNAVIIVDHYHVAQDLARKVTSSRSLILDYLADKIAALPDSDTKKVKLKELRNTVAKDSYLFKFGEDKLAEKSIRLSLLTELCIAFPEFNHLRLLKSGFERIYKAETREEAEKMYAEWKDLVPPTGVKKIAAWEDKYKVSAELYNDFRVFLRTTENWNDEIFSYFDYDVRYSNAATEGLNCMTERINRNGNGLSFQRLRAKALFWHEATDRVRYSASKIREAVPSKPTIAKFNLYDYRQGSTPFADFNEQKKYQTRIHIIEERDQRENRPVSVFAYLPKDYQNSEEYFFGI